MRFQNTTKKDKSFSDLSLQSINRFILIYYISYSTHYKEEWKILISGSLTLTNSQNCQKSFRYGFFYVKFLFFNVVCVVYL